MKKKLLSLLLAFMLCVGLLPVVASAADSYTYGELTYTVLGEAIIITDCDQNATTVVIPSEIDGKPVVSIGVLAFYDCNSLTSVTIPNSVTTIGINAFDHCSSLATLTIPNSVTEIGDYAFRACTGLTDIVLPASLTSLGKDAFNGCNCLKTISVDSNNTNYCTDSAGVLFDGEKTELIVAPRDISSYAIPSTVKTIDSYAFQNCKKLTAVTIPGSVATIGYEAFYGCSGLTCLNIPDSVTTIGYNAFYGCSSLTDVTIPDSLTTIKGGTFGDCSSLTDVTISNSVTIIEGGAFIGCSSLVNVTIPASVSTIGNAPFKNCTSLIAIHVATENDNYCSVDGVLFTKDKTGLIQFPGGFSGSYTIPDGVETLMSASFWGCEKLTSVTLPSGITKGYRDGSVTHGWWDVFCQCKSLSEVVISAGIDVLYIHAFNGCSSLNRLVLPATITEISPTLVKASGDLYLTAIQFTGDAPKFYSTSFYGLTATMYYPMNNTTWTKEIRQNYGGTITWVPYDGYGKCGDNLTWMVCKTDDTTVDGTAYKLIISGTGDMYDFTGTDRQPWYQYNQHNHGSSGGNYITEVVIEPGITHIGKSAFAEFCKVAQIVVPEGVKSIGAYAFQDNTSMKVTLPASLKTVNYQAGTPDSVEYNGCKHQWESITFAYLSDIFSSKSAWTSVVQCKPNTNQDDGDCTTALYCSVCGGVDIAARDGHSFTNYVSNNDATCTADGTKTAKCDNCDATDTVTDVGSKTNHSFTNYVSNNDATCMADGTKTAHCDTAGCTATDTVTDVGSKTSHSFTNYVSNNDATCMADGTKTAHCDTVGCTATDTVADEGSKKNHSFTDYKSNNDATCTADGTKTAKCDNCDATNTIADEGSATGHDFSNNAEYCRNGCGTKNPNYTAPVMPPYMPVKPTPTPVPTPVEPEQSENLFTDVRKDDYFFDAVIWAAEEEITKGTSATTFSPDDFCTRAQIVTFLYRYQQN